MRYSRMTLSPGRVSRFEDGYVVFDAAAGSSATISFGRGSPVTEEALLMILVDRLGENDMIDHRVASYIMGALGCLQIRDCKPD